MAGDDSEGSSAGEVVAQVAGSLVGAAFGLTMAGPAGAFLGAGIGPATAAGLAKLMSTTHARRQDRVERVVVSAANAANVDADELLARLDASPERQELLVRTLTAAQDAALVPKLILLGRALARGSIADPQSVSGETAFVRALADCDIAHMAVLNAFVHTPAVLRGESEGGSGMPLSTGSLNAKQVQRVFPILAPLLDPLFATLQRHGLIAPVQSGTGFFGSAANRNQLYDITGFGRSFMDRVGEVGSFAS